MSTGQDRRHFPALPAQVAQPTDPPKLSEWTSVLVKACQHDPRLRYPSAEAMQADLARLQAGRSVRRKRTLERRRAMLKKVSLPVTTLAILGAGVWFSSTMFHQDAPNQ